jgi:hypothetical protein
MEGWKFSSTFLDMYYVDVSGQLRPAAALPTWKNAIGAH